MARKWTDAAPHALLAIAALAHAGCSNLAGYSNVASTQGQTRPSPPAVFTEPECDSSSFESLSISGGSCVGLGCGKYSLDARLDVPTGVYVERFAGVLSAEGSRWWNSRLRASVNSYQVGIRAEGFYRSVMTIQEPVDGPIEGRYSVTFVLSEQIDGVRRECMLRRENTFAGKIDVTERPDSAR